MPRDDVTAEQPRKPQSSAVFGSLSELLASQSAIGSTIGPYKIISRLGEGGFGSVYLAEQSTPIQRRVALKLIKPGMDSRSVDARFEAERQALALMDHPSVAKVFDGGISEHGRPFFVMELVQGEPITRFCDLERFSVDERVRLMIQVCSAVQHAHMKGLLHRDLKPSNILVSRVDGTPLPKVIDFGVAKALHHRLGEATIYTETGQMIGTPEYMSPEQARGSADVDTRADIYALGAILYELLTGVTPVDLKEPRTRGHAGVERTIEQVQPAIPSRRLSELAKAGQVPTTRAIDLPATLKQVRGELDWIVMKCLEKQRSRRYDSAAALADDLQRYLKDEPVQAGPPSAAYRAAKFVRRHRVAVFSIALIMVALVGGVIGTSYGLAKAVRETKAAQEAREESEAVTTFLTQMIESVQPEEAGKDVTVREVLDSSSPLLQTGFKNRPIVEARLRHAIGLSYWGLGELKEADKHLPAAYEIRRLHLGPDHLDTLRAAVNLASFRLHQGQFLEAERLLRDAVDRFNRTVGEDDPLTVSALNNLAVVYARQDANDEALAIQTRVYESQKRLLGEAHPHTLGALVNCADLLSEMGRMDEAEPMMREAVSLWEKHHGFENPSALVALHALGLLQMRMQDFDDAIQTMRRVIELRERMLGESHMDTLGALANLGIVYTNMGRLPEAEATLSRVLKGFRVALGDSHPNTLLVISQLASVLDSQDWPDRSRLLTEEIVIATVGAASRNDLSPGDLNNLAWTLLHVKPVELRNIPAALQLATRACNGERAIGGADLWMYLDTLADAQHQAGEFASALATQREAIRLIPQAGEPYREEMQERATKYEQAAATPSHQ